MKKKIELDAPMLGGLEKEYLGRCIDSGFVSTAGPFVPEFEAKFADIVGTKAAVAVQSGTAALHVALLELGVGNGDEVILPAVTFVATANVVKYCGATPVFVDIDPDTWNMDPAEVEKKITARTKAVIPVHLYGNPCEMGRIMETAERNGVPVVEDATESLCAEYHGRKTGTFGKFGCFSFNGNKIITTGGGGMVVTDDERAAKHIKYLVNQAKDEGSGYCHSEIGYNYRMTNLEAALGLAQLERLPEFIRKKKMFREIYGKQLEGLPGVKFQLESPGASSSWWMVSISLDSGDRLDRFMEELARGNIPARRLFAPITCFAPYKEYSTSDFPHSNDICRRSVNLPGSAVNTEESIDEAAVTIREILERVF